MTLVFSFIAYYMIFALSKKMSNFEFPAVEFQDHIIAQHSIIIRGVAKDVGTEEANRNIRKVFEEHLGGKEVVAVHTLRNCENVEKLYRKLKKYKYLVQQYRQVNHYAGSTEREQIIIGSSWRCNKKLVDAEKYFSAKLDDTELQLLKLRELNRAENIGVAFVSFKDKSNVADCVEEIELIKQRLIGRQYADTVDVQSWEVDNAFPPSDILWTNLNSDYQADALFATSTNCCSKMLFHAVPFFTSILTVVGLIVISILSVYRSWKRMLSS